jgi:hypothetical protein
MELITIAGIINMETRFVGVSYKTRRQKMKNVIVEHQKKWAVCVAKAWADEDYKQRLMSDTAAVLKEEGFVVPEGMRIKVVENTRDLLHMVIPAKPDSAEGAIEDVEERLAAMSCLCLCLLGTIQALGDAITGSLLTK